MPRPRRFRNIGMSPHVTFYKPQGIPLNQLEIMKVSHDEWEAIRLKTKENMNQIEAAQVMGVSQSTFQRILSSAQNKINTAILNGMGILILIDEE